MQDYFGLEASTGNTTVIDAINHFSQALLMSGSDGAKVFDAAKENPESILLNCFAAALFLYCHDDKDHSHSVDYLKKAKSLIPSSNERERLYYKAVQAWYDRDHETALDTFELITQKWPRDCVAAKFAEWLFYCLGQKYHAKRFLNMTTPMYELNKNEPGFLATHSFALELNGHYAQSLEMAEQALSLEKVTPWAHHTIGHALLLSSKIDQGIAKLESFKPLWKGTLPPLCGHNTWHLSLFYLANRNEDKCLELFSPGIWGGAPGLSLEQIDAISLLWRMEMAGFSQDKLLENVAKELGEHVYQQYIPFDNAHYVYALAKTGHHQAVQKAIDSIKTHKQPLWKNIALPMMQGIAAFAQEDYKMANHYFEPLTQDVLQMGGSDAQDELFLQTMMISLLRAGEKQKAAQFMQKHFPYYEKTVLGEYWM